MLIIAALAIAVVIGYVATQTLQSAAVYYLTPTEATKRAIPAGQPARIGGLVLPGTLVYEPVSRRLTFTLSDGVTKLRVVGSGAPPGLLREGAGAVVEGTFGTDGIFRATQVIAKHDEVYTAPTGSAVPTHQTPAP